MPARKPAAIQKRHSTKKEKLARESAESAMTPRTRINAKPPAALAKHPVAAATWTRLVRLYDETSGTIITAFDQDLLIKLCMAEEELVEELALRAEVMEMWKTHLKLMKRFKPDPQNIKDYLGALAQANALLQRFQGVDGRMDNKRKMIHDMAKSLYLTPRSRAGAAPQEKPPEVPKSEIEELMD